MNRNMEKTIDLLGDLTTWHGEIIMDLICMANYDSYDEPALWDSDPDLDLSIGDILDVEALLILGGCLDAP